MTVATRKILLSGLLGIVSATSVITATSYAASQPAWVQKMSRPLLHEALAKAIENDDYDAFSSAVTANPGAQSANNPITHDQFDALVVAYRLHEVGQDTQAQTVLSDAGITAS